MRWWWNNTHQAVYAGSGGGWVPQGPATEWVAQSKSIVMLEYGFSSIDKATNQPNVFFDAKSTESATPYWSIWDNAGGLGYLPRRDDTIAALALQAVYDYWNTDGNNATSGGGLPMLQWAFACVWNWDARPFPTFPLDSRLGRYRQLGGRRLDVRAPDLACPPGTDATAKPRDLFDLPGPLDARMVGQHHAAVLDGRRRACLGARNALDRPRVAAVRHRIDLRALAHAAAAYEEFRTIAGFFEEMGGADQPFWIAPPGLSAITGQAIGTGDGSTTVFPLVASVGPFTGPVYGTSGVSGVYLDGVSQGSGWTVSSGYAPTVTFATAPAAGVAISVDFGVLWLCRFADDVVEFEQFMSQLFALKTLKLQTVRP